MFINCPISLTLYKGAHEITFGTQDYSRKYADAFVPSFAGSYQFPSLTAFYNSANAIGNANSYYQQWSNIPGGTFPFYFAGSTELGFFVQDKWRVTNNFTLTYGLRFDMTIYKSLFLDNPFFDKLTFKDGASYNIGKAPGNAILISPRVGFNWDALSDRTLAGKRRLWDFLRASAICMAGQSGWKQRGFDRRRQLFKCSVYCRCNMQLPRHR